MGYKITMKKDKNPPLTPQEAWQTLYETLLNAIPSSVLLIDRSLRVVSANRNFLKKNKRTLSDTLGQPLKKIFPEAIYNYLNLDRSIRKVFLLNSETDGERIAFRTPGSPLRNYYYRILPLLHDNCVNNILLFMEDVTEQVRLSAEVRRVERHLSSVVESASDIVLSLDNKGMVLTWSNAAEKILGFSREEVKGNPFFKYCGDACREEVKHRLAGLKTREESFTAEWDMLPKTGNSIPVSWVCSPMKDGCSQTVGIVAVGRDLTERRAFEIQLLQSQKLAALGVMAGGIAHEIRNPLAICSSAAQFLMTEEKINSVFLKECAQKIHVGLQRASTIIENLLKFAHPSRNLEIERINLLPLIMETLNLVANEVKLQKIKLTTKFPAEDVFVGGVRGLLQQVFMNLFLNAIKSMPQGGYLKISIEKLGTEVLIRLGDTGFGISPQDIDRIFDPFFTTFSSGKGIGLGLSICYSIVKQHFGSIEVNSTEGEGTTVSVRFPLLSN